MKRSHFLPFEGAWRQNLFVLLLLAALAIPASAIAKSACPAGVPVGTFKITVLPAKGGTPLPLSEVNVIGPGEKVRYEPVKLTDDMKKKARVSLIVVPAMEDGEKHLSVLPAQEVTKPAEWEITERVSAIGVVFGPHGIDTKKVASLVHDHPEIVTKLADYAEQTSRVEAMVQALSTYESSAPSSLGLQSVMQGFSSQYGVQLPTLDSNTAASQQALALVRALAPAVAADDPLPGRSNLLVKTGGVAGSLAATYFGTPVALAIGGAQLANNLRTALFPPTNFRSAFAETATDGTKLCTANTGQRPKGNIDYLWMTRVPNEEAPKVALEKDANVPVGSVATINVKTATVAQLRTLTRAREWRLVEGAHESKIPVKLEPGAGNDKLTLDLSHTRIPAGQYQLAAKWDWTALPVEGTVYVRPFGNMAEATLTADSQDALVTGSGSVKVQLTGTDFEFVDAVSMRPAAKEKAVPVTFTLPDGPGAGEPKSMEAEIATDALKPGAYQLLIKQTNGVTQDVAFKVHPPNPVISPAPMRVNVGEPEQIIEVHGSGLARIEKITSDLATWRLRPAKDGSALTATVKLDPKAQAGEKIAGDVYVADLQKPLHVADLLTVAGPRPKILSVTKSLGANSSTERREGELPAGQPASFSMTVQNAATKPTVELGCKEDSNLRHRVSLMPGDKNGAAQLDFASGGTLFLSVDPGAVGDSGCEMTAKVTEEGTGTSDAYELGRVIRLPQIEKLDVSDERLSPEVYAGTITGKDLQLIEKTGWSSNLGEAVKGIPTMLPGTDQEQSLKIAVPWPPPSPKARLYVWLRGESKPRVTEARY